MSTAARRFWKTYAVFTVVLCLGLYAVEAIAFGELDGLFYYVDYVIGPLIALGVCAYAFSLKVAGVTFWQGMRFIVPIYYVATTLVLAPDILESFKAAEDIPPLLLFVAIAMTALIPVLSALDTYAIWHYAKRRRLMAQMELATASSA